MAKGSLDQGAVQSHNLTWCPDINVDDCRSHHWPVQLEALVMKQFRIFNGRENRGGRTMMFCTVFDYSQVVNDIQKVFALLTSILMAPYIFLLHSYMSAVKELNSY